MTTISRTHRSPIAALALVLGVLTALLLPAANAHAASAYRFWGYFQYTAGQWQFAQKGADQLTPKEGDIEGWRFAVSDMSSQRLPRATADFNQICGGTATVEGKKRVAVVIDFGRPADSPDGRSAPPSTLFRCAQVDSAATGAQVLAAAAQPRVEKGLTCAINNYPATACGGEVKNPTPEMLAADAPGDLATPTATAQTPAGPATSTPAPVPTSSSSNLTPLILGVVALLVMAAIAVTVVRRHKAVGTTHPDA